eukprot:TRINITY_DN4906_c0_g4_i2.p1 TRINITY_DN4906_c0_g4~~TRINITY_DN4906_c0_g4_i2.p1  ORF type:complete len:215 (+),score=45.84 TRINITY_DN4906_c0_g4_i2:266-910(+)
MMAWGCCAGSMCSYWYSWLGGAAASMALSPWKEIGYKLFFDQILFQPLCINSFYLFTSALEGMSGGEIKAKMQNKVLPSWMVATPFWSVTQVMNFKLTPLQYQPIVVYIASLANNTIMSLISHAQEYGTPTEQMLARRVDEVRDELSNERHALAGLEHRLAVSQMQLAAVTDLLPDERRAEAGVLVQQIWEMAQVGDIHKDESQIFDHEIIMPD